MRLEHWWYTLPLKWRSLVRRSQVEQDLDDEIRDHFEREVELRVARGVPRTEAYEKVAQRFGPVDLAKEQCRDARGLELINTFLQDVRYAVRTLRHNPGFAVVAVLTLAIAIGANTAVYSLVDGILLAPLPYPAPEQLVSVTGTFPNGAFAAMRNEVRTLDVAAYAEGHSATISVGGTATRIAVTRTSAELFSILGAKPALGRWPRSGEDLAPRDRVIVLSHALWVSRFNRDPAIIGHFVRVDDVPREVIAVMPPTFRFPSVRTEAWVPLGMDPTNASQYWAGDFMPVVARIRPSASIAEAHGEIQLFQSHVGALFPWRMPNSWNKNISVIPLRTAMVGSVRPRLLILIAAVALVLVIACANVANLSLSKAVAREREIGIRTAVGASPSRIARQLLTESVVIAAFAAVIGVVLATQALSLLKLVLPQDTPRLAEAVINWRVLAMTGVLAIATGCAFGMAPALHALRLRLRATLDAGGRSGRTAVAGPARTALTIAQIACAVLLVIAAGLLVRGLWTLSRVDPGFTANAVVTVPLSPTESLCGTSERCLTFYRTLESDLDGAPGIQAAALVNTLPLTGAVAKRSLQLEGFMSPDAPLFWLNVITPDYFRVMQIGLASGRAFTRQDLAGPPVAIVTASTARRFWPNQNPIGKHVRFVGEKHWHTIVGIAADVRGFDLTRNVPEWIAGSIYVPYSANATQEDGRIPTDLTLALRTTLDPGRVREMVQRTSGAAGGQLALGDVRPMTRVVEDAMAAPSATASLLVTMAALAMVLGCIGVYGVLSFLVSRQVRDFGIRIALGAQRRDVFWLVIKDGARLCVTGIAIGVLGAFGITRWLSSELYGVSPTDPLTYVAVVIAVAAVTLTACYVPTRRAMAVDPMIALREP
jgi:predicted permease